MNVDDRHVLLLVAGPGVASRTVKSSPLETTQVALTILSLLGLSPAKFAAVRTEGTKVLPGIVRQPVVRAHVS